MSARTIPWETIADWFAENEQQIRDVMKFEGLRGAVNEVLRIAPDQPELSVLREELAERKRKHLRSCQLAIGKSQLAKELQQRLTAAEQRNAAMAELLDSISKCYAATLSLYTLEKIAASLQPTESGASE